MDYLHTEPVIEIKVGENGNKLAFKRNNTLSTIWPSMMLIMLYAIMYISVWYFAVTSMHCTTAGIGIDKSIHLCENDILCQLRKSIV